MLLARGMKVHVAEDGLRALEMLGTEAIDVALVDLMMPRLAGFELLKRARTAYPDIEVVMMTAFGDVETAVKVVQAGAFDFITKPFSNDDLERSIERAAAKRRASAHVTVPHRVEEGEDKGFGGMIGTSPAMRAVYRNVVGVAATRATVLILGESGTGKELTARAIHERSERRSRPFIPVNCSAIPEGVVESELFGHVKGAFTNATSPRSGLFEAANQGTIFLDEVGDLPQQAQVKLLRTLQEGEVKRVGSNETRKVDVRVIAATNVDLRKKIEEGRFREDLYYRLNVVAITLPSLRDRRTDIPALAYHFLKKHSARVGHSVDAISREALELLCTQPWPGNVRELENAVERAVVFAKDEILPDHLGLGDPLVSPLEATLSALDGSNGAAEGTRLPDGLVELPYREAKARAVAAFERHYFSSLRSRTQSNVSEAARQAGLDRSNFRRAVKRAGVAWREE